MKGDPGSSYTIEDGLDAQSRVAATTYTSVVDHALAPAATFHLSCGVFAGSSLLGTLQWSDAPSTGFVDEADTTAGNEVSEELTEAGQFNVDCPNPRGRYSRLKVVGDGTCEYGVTKISGPIRFIDQG